MRTVWSVRDNEWWAKRKNKLPPHTQVVLVLKFIAYTCLAILFPPLWFFLYMKERSED
jgi:hypothetical protein